MAKYDDTGIGVLRDYYLNNAAIYWLRKAGIHTVGTLCGHTPAQLSELHGVGPAYLEEIQYALGALGLTLADETASVTPEEAFADARVTGEGVTRVKVRFSATGAQRGTNTEYAYLCDIPGVAVGDHVVVDTPSNGLTIAKVIQIGDTVENVTKATKWIVDKVDVSAHKARLARIERKKLLEAQLEQALAEELRKDRYARLAQSNEALAKLVEEFNQL